MIPEKFGNSYHIPVEKVTYIKDIDQKIWQIINHTHLLVDTILMADKEVRQQLGDKNTFETDSVGQVKKNQYNQPVYSEKYLTFLNQKLNGMVEKQMILATKVTADFWFTAWVNAGRPDLSNIDSTNQTKQSKKQLKKELKRLKNTY